MLTNWLILDVATAPITDAALYLEGSVKAPSNYKDPEAIAAYVREKEAERLEMAATDVDLARVIGIGLWSSSKPKPDIGTAEWPLTWEATGLEWLAEEIRAHKTLVTFGGIAFDLPVVMRRARYLGVKFPAISLDRFKSPVVDLCELLSDRDFKRRRSLQWYAKRLDMGITKPLSGAEESQVPQSLRWRELRESLIHDVTATYNLGVWLEQIAPVKVDEQEPVF